MPAWLTRTRWRRRVAEYSGTGLEAICLGMEINYPSFFPTEEALCTEVVCASHCRQSLPPS